MKRIFVNTLVLGLLSMSCFTACKKDVTPVVVTPVTVTPITAEEIAGSYSVTAMTENSSSNGDVDIYNEYYQDCQKDDVIKLNVDMSAEHLDAGAQCNPAGDTMSTWSLNGDNTITIEGEIFTIYYHNSSVLILTSDTRYGRNSGSVTTTFSKL